MVELILTLNDSVCGRLNSILAINEYNHCDMPVQGVVTYMSPVEAFATAIKLFDPQSVLDA